MSVPYRNAVLRTDGTIDCEVEHPSFGWIPFTAQDESGEEFQQEVWDALVAGDEHTGTPVPRPAGIVIATRVQVSLWLDSNGFSGGLGNASIVAAAAAIDTANGNSEASIRLGEGQVFTSEDPFLTAAAPGLGVTDLDAAISAAAQL